MCKSTAFTIDRGRPVWNYDNGSKEKIYHL
jgi:hypothetical protein